jgi:hypothetical protein
LGGVRSSADEGDIAAWSFLASSATYRAANKNGKRPALPRGGQTTELIIENRNSRKKLDIF